MIWPFSAAEYASALADRQSLRDAVEEQCLRCRAGQAHGGAHRQHLIATCNDPGCALYDVRPYQGGGR